MTVDSEFSIFDSTSAWVRHIAAAPTGPETRPSASRARFRSRFLAVCEVQVTRRRGNFRSRRAVSQASSTKKVSLQIESLPR